MRFIPSQLLTLGWNKRVLTFEDFEQLCWDIGVRVYRPKLRHDAGLFFARRGHPVIVLNKSLTDGMLQWVAWHELVHYFLHPPELQYFAPGTTQKADFEANVIAICALIPLRYVLTKTHGELHDEYGYTKEMTDLRKEVYERFNF